MKYSDMHCDTLTELYSHRYCIESSPLHVSLDAAKECGIDTYLQLSAVWTDCSLSDREGFERFSQVLSYIKGSPAVKEGRLALVSSARELDRCTAEKVPAFVIGVEGGRILQGDISKLESLYRDGVRLMTLVWSGGDCIGGAYDTDLPLTEFGTLTVRGLCRFGMAVDVSHACDVTASAALDIAEDEGGIVCASHSNSRAVCGHMRNLTDPLFCRIRDMGGVVGISMYPPHLTEDRVATSEHILRHIYHYLELGGEGTVCLGCDFDGIEMTPADVRGICHVPALAETLLRHRIDEATVSRIFYENAHSFIRRILSGCENKKENTAEGSAI